MDNKRKEYNQEILSLILDNKFSKAKREIKKNFKKYPDQFDLIFKICKDFQKSRRHKQSLEFAKILYIKYPKEIRGNLIYIETLLKRKYFSKANKIINEALYLIKKDTKTNFFKSYFRKFFIALRVNYLGNNLNNKNIVKESEIEIKNFYEKIIQKKSELNCLRKKPILFALPTEINPHEIFKSDNNKFQNYSLKRKLLDEYPLTNEEKKDDDLKTIICKNAVVTGYYGAHTIDGNPYYGTVLKRNIKTYPNGIPTKLNSNDIKITKTLEKAFYIYYMTNSHFGHLITDGVSSISSLLHIHKFFGAKILDLPLIMHKSFKKSANLIEEFFGLKKGKILIPGINCEDIFVKNLYLSSPTFLNRRWVTKKHCEYVKYFLHGLNKSNKEELLSVPKFNKVYISRSKLPNNKRKLKDEEILEDNLIKLGWHIFHPQEHSIDFQIKTYENASFICSQHSSALHLLYAVNTKKIKKIIILHFGLYENYYFQFKTQEIEFKDILCLKREKVQDADVEFSEDYALNELPKLIENYCNL